MSKFMSDLEKALGIYRDMKMLIDICKSYEGYRDMWEISWDYFWEMSNDFPFKVDWYDTDTTYEEDIMSRYLAIEEFMEGFRVDQENRMGKDKKLKVIPIPRCRGKSWIERDLRIAYQEYQNIQPDEDTKKLMIIIDDLHEDINRAFIVDSILTKVK